MKKTPLKLGDTTLLLGPLLAATVRDNKAEIAQARTGQIAAEDLIELTVTLVLACAQRLDPAVTREQVEQLIDMENQTQAMAAVWGVSIPEADPSGETQAAVNPPT
jgi:hypothetical protein